jgi:hypothetical protein
LPFPYSVRTCYLPYSRLLRRSGRPICRLAPSDNNLSLRLRFGFSPTRTRPLNSPPERYRKNCLRAQNSSFGWFRISERPDRLSCGIDARLARDSHPKCAGLRRLFFLSHNRLSLIRLQNRPDGSASAKRFPGGAQFGMHFPKNAGARSPGAESACSARPDRGYG